MSSQEPQGAGFLLVLEDKPTGLLASPFRERLWYRLGETVGSQSTAPAPQAWLLLPTISPDNLPLESPPGVYYSAVPRVA